MIKTKFNAGDHVIVINDVGTWHDNYPTIGWTGILNRYSDDYWIINWDHMSEEEHRLGWYIKDSNIKLADGWDL